MKSRQEILKSWLPAVAVLVLMGGCGVLGPAPVASMTVEPLEGQVPFQVRVDSSASGPGSAIVRELSIDGGPFEEIEELHALAITTVGSHELTLRVSNSYGRAAFATATVVAEPGAATSSGFQIDLVYPGERADQSVRSAFAAAAATWSRLVVGDIADAYLEASHVEQSCGATYRYSGAVDDLLLIADVKAIDGPGGVVGMAGSCLLRQDGFPVVGLVVLDSEDVDNLVQGGRLPTVILHELGHVLELSQSGWQERDLLEYEAASCLDSSQVHFLGERAALEYQRLGGSGPVPVEANGVPGTACSHWDEESLGRELMTGYLDLDSRLSTVTAGALADLGYRVDFTAAEPYSLPAVSTFRSSSLEPFTEQLIRPGGVLTKDGTFLPLEPREGPQLPLHLPSTPAGGAGR